jgi:hypothetical protein
MVGGFLFHWNMFERDLATYVETLFRLQRLDACIIGANLNFQSKMSILYSAVDLYLVLKPEDKELFNRAYTLNTEWRNLIAHTPYGPNGTAVKFLRIQAKRELKFPDTIRGHAEFKEIFKEIPALSKAIGKLVKRANASRTEYEARKNQRNAPMLNFSALTQPHPQNLPLGGLLGSPSAMTGIFAQIPPEPQAKAEGEEE